jgi:hypothetical protein
LHSRSRLTLARPSTNRLMVLFWICQHSKTAAAVVDGWVAKVEQASVHLWGKLPLARV